MIRPHIGINALLEGDIDPQFLLRNSAAGIRNGLPVMHVPSRNMPAIPIRVFAIRQQKVLAGRRDNHLDCRNRHDAVDCFPNIQRHVWRQKIAFRKLPEQCDQLCNFFRGHTERIAQKRIPVLLFKQSAERIPSIPNLLDTAPVLLHACGCLREIPHRDRRSGSMRIPQY